MNANLTAAIAVIMRTAGVDEDTAIRTAQALEADGLLAARPSAGIVLHKHAGGWSRRPATGLEQRPAPTDLEQQALRWDASCGRAVRLAEVIRSECGEGRGLLRVQVEQDRLLVSVQVTDTAQWGAWRQYLGIREQGPQSLDYAYVGSGHRDGVAVSVVAYDAPQTEARTVAAAGMPHKHEGVVYDLALPLRDSQGDVWDYRETRADGMPLLVQRGVESDARCSLANVVDYVGPLTAVREPVSVPGVRAPQPADAGAEVLA